MPPWIGLVVARQASAGRIGEVSGEMGNIKTDLGGLNSELGNQRDDSRKLTQSTAQAAMEEIQHAVRDLEGKVSQEFNQKMESILVESRQRETQLQASNANAMEGQQKDLTERQTKVDEVLQDLKRAGEQAHMVAHNVSGRVEGDMRELHVRVHGYESSLESVRAGLEAQIEGLAMRCEQLTATHRMPMLQPDNTSLALQEAATAARQMQHGFEEKLRHVESSVYDKLNWGVEQLRREVQESLRGYQTQLEDATRRTGEQSARESSGLSERIERGLGEAMHVANQALTQTREMAHEMGRLKEQPLHQAQLPYNTLQLQQQQPAVREMILANQNHPEGHHLWQEQKADMAHLELRWKGEAERWQMEATSLRGELASQRQEFGLMLQKSQVEMVGSVMKEVEARQEATHKALQASRQEWSHELLHTMEQASVTATPATQVLVRDSITHAMEEASNGSATSVRNAIDLERREREREIKAAVSHASGVVSDGAMRSIEAERQERHQCIEAEREAWRSAVEALGGVVRDEAMRWRSELDKTNREAASAKDETAARVAQSVDAARAAALESEGRVSQALEAVAADLAGQQADIASFPPLLAKDAQDLRTVEADLRRVIAQSSGHAQRAIEEARAGSGLELRREVSSLDEKVTGMILSGDESIKVEFDQATRHLQGLLSQQATERQRQHEALKQETNELRGEFRSSVEEVRVGLGKAVAAQAQESRAAMAALHAVKVEQDSKQSQISTTLDGIAEDTRRQMNETNQTAHRLAGEVGHQQSVMGEAVARLEKEISSRDNDIANAKENANTRIATIGSRLDALEGSRMADVEASGRKHQQSLDDTARAIHLVTADSREQVQEALAKVRRDIDDVTLKCTSVARDEAKRAEDVAVAAAKDALSHASTVHDQQQALARQLSGVGTRIDGLENHLHQAESKITTVETTGSSLTGRLGAIEGRLNASDATQTSLAANHEANAVRVQSLEHRFETAEHETRAHAQRIAENSAGVVSNRQMGQGHAVQLEQLERHPHPTQEDVQAVRQEIRSLAVTTQGSLGSLEGEIGTVKEAAAAASRVGVEGKEIGQRAVSSVENLRAVLDKVERETIQEMGRRIEQTASLIDTRDAATRRYCVDHLGEEFRAMCIMAEAERETAVNRVQKHVDRVARDLDEAAVKNENALMSVKEASRHALAELDLRSTSRWDCTRQAFQFVGHKLEATDTLNSVLTHQ